jgi:small-conductance mechanosensitive channel
MTRISDWARHWLAVCLLILATASWASAQFTEENRAYLEAWKRTAERAERAIDADRASEIALEALRRELASYRETFQAARGRNAERIKTLQAQLEALGPEPEGGDASPDIAALRDTLNQRLLSLRVPQIVSEEAYSHANGLIAEIDKIIRTRRGDALIARGPSPINPEHWGPALRSLRNAMTALWNETAKQIAADTTRERILSLLPPILGLLALSLVLLARGRSWAHRIGEHLRSYGGRGTGVWSFVVSLIEVLLPFLGVFALVQAVSLAGILGVRGTLILEAVPQWTLILLAFNWLSERLVGTALENDLIPVREGRRAQTRILIGALAVMLVLRDALGYFLHFENLTPASQAVIGFPLIVASALILMGLHRIGLRQRPVDEGSEDSEGESAIAANANRLIRLLRRMSYLLAYLAPMLAVLGYLNAAEALIYPVIMTLGLLAGLLVLQRFAGDLYGWISNRGDAARDSLLTVLVGFGLALMALPLLALIWGARVADLTEIWAKFLAGFQIGDTRISPTSFLLFALVFAVGYMLTRLVQSSLRNSLLPKTRLDPGGQNAIVSGTGYVGIFLAALVAITMAGLDLSSLAIVAGALSVGIGFGLQNIVSNFVSGIILLIERPVSKGDWIEVNGVMGYVRDISVRSTRIETFDRTDVILPNSDLISGSVTNYTRGNTVGRVIVPVGVAYGTDTRKVESILRDIAEAHPMVLANPAPSVVFQGFGADSLDFEIRAILRDVNWVLSVKSDMNYEINRRFAEEGIEIPFAQRDLWLRNPEALRPAVDPGAAPGGRIEPDLGDMSGAAEGDADNV